MTRFRISEHTQWLTLDQPLVLESGVSLPQVQVAYRTWGSLSAAGDNAVVVCHALTGSADVDDWWAPMFGEGKTLDPTQHFIVCSNVLGGCYGTTGPTSLAPDGQPWGGRFPEITVRDQVSVQMQLADALGIRQIRFVLGGSMGGLQALEWAVMDPDRVQSVVSIAASGRHSAWCAAWSEAQRLTLAADPAFLDGHYPLSAPPRQGLSAARAVAMVSYRSPQCLANRFDRHTGSQVFSERSQAPDELAVRGWLRHHGAALADRFDANSYLRLINAMDTHDLGRGRGGYGKAVRGISQPILIGSITSDALYVPDEQYSLANALPKGELFTVHSPYGHDGFLIEASQFEQGVRRFVQARGWRQHKAAERFAAHTALFQLVCPAC